MSQLSSQLSVLRKSLKLQSKIEKEMSITKEVYCKYKVRENNYQRLHGRYLRPQVMSTNDLNFKSLQEYPTKMGDAAE